ncbi:hypothetical protein KC19_2G038800 [Ceratodon purpureus]|uniref:SET domain-containing protein n=1 Tax=Ceratodon purpureus TaxID=3225 RepID=A0A8T0IPX0_CERPU|nr:hypothetical protein KC19_2G038800 [Ceratodon purpureus]
MSAPPGHMEPTGGSPGKKLSHHEGLEASPGAHPHSKYVGPTLAETVHAAEKFDKTGLLAAHLAALHDAHMLERGLLPGTSLPDSEAPPIPPVYAESPWKDLKPLTLAEMKVGKTHRRHFLEGRLCAKSLKVTSVVNVLEEASGLATKIILTNALPARASMAQAQNCYPEGARVTVRDPYLTRFPDGVVGVLVERPNDIAFLSRPESTGENGTRIYGAVGLEGYDNDRVAHSTSREHGDFSRKIHMFEEQMKQETAFHSPSHSHSVGHLKPLSHAHRDDMTSSRSSPAKEAPKERSSPAKEAPKERSSPAQEAPKERSSPTKEEPKAVLVEETVAPQEIIEGRDGGPSPASDNVVSEEEPSTNTLEAPSVASKEELPSVSVEEPAIVEAVVEEKEIETPEEHPSALLPNDDEDNVPEVSSRELPVEEPSKAAHHDEVSGDQGESSVEEATKPQESSVEVVDKSGEEETHSTEAVKKVEELVSGKEDDRVSTEVSESTSEQLEEAPVANGEPTHEEQPIITEAAAEPKVPLIRKQFQRSDSLLAVHENEHDSKSSAGEWAGEPAISEKPSTPEHEEKETSDMKEQATSQSAKPANSDKLVETHNANDLRVLGNLCFGEENYQGAADLYTRSLRLAEDEEKRQGKLVCSREIILGYSNRAEAYIRLQEFDKALADAKKALLRDPSHLKSLFRKGRALLGLSHYEQALTTLQAAAPRAPSDRDLQAALHESSTAVQQSCHGHYDLSHYYLKGKQMGESPHCADYIGPVIVTDVGRGRGRGLVLTKDVEAGELLLVSNPIMFLPLQYGDQTRNDISQAFVNGKVQEGFRKIIESSHSHNKGLEKLPTLYDGEKALPAPSVHQTHFESASHLDAAHIRRVIQLNAINGDATMGWKNLPGSGEQDQKVEHWGLWWLPSFINHSCLPSSSPILVGKALFVFASRDLRAGDEVTRPYFDIFQPLEQRKELSAKGWGFICYCPRCKLEDALHTSLSKVTEDYVHLMELASQSKAEFGTDEKLSAMQTSAALKFFHKLETKLKDFKLNASENNWVRSSFLHYIDMISGDHELHTHLESIVEALVTVCPGSETTLHMAVVAKDSSKRTFGKKSNQLKHSNQRALNICRYTYGKQRLSVLQSIVDKNDYQS